MSRRDLLDVHEAALGSTGLVEMLEHQRHVAAELVDLGADRRRSRDCPRPARTSSMWNEILPGPPFITMSLAWHETTHGPSSAKPSRIIWPLLK